LLYTQLGSSGLAGNLHQERRRQEFNRKLVMTDAVDRIGQALWGSS
jgi:hypothetical protein